MDQAALAAKAPASGQSVRRAASDPGNRTCSTAAAAETAKIGAQMENAHPGGVIGVVLPPVFEPPLSRGPTVGTSTNAAVETPRATLRPLSAGVIEMRCDIAAPSIGRFLQARGIAHRRPGAQAQRPVARGAAAQGPRGQRPDRGGARARARG